MVAVLLATVGPASAETSRRGCKVPRGAQVEARTKYAVVYYDSRDGLDYGCLFSLGRRALLYDADDSLDHAFTLAGRYVAYPQTSSEAEGTTHYLLTVFDLRQRGWRTLSPAYVAVSGGNPDGEDSALIHDVALKKNGSVAWISCFPYYGDPYAPNCRRDSDTPPEVWRTDRRGTKMLDASTKLSLHSLKRRGNTITWRHGSQRRTAQLK